MRLICETLDDTLFVDVILNSDELDCMRFGEMIEAQQKTLGFKIMVGARMNGRSNYGQEEAP